MTLGPRSSTGYWLRLVSVREERVRLVAQVEELAPSLGDKVSAELTYPVLLVTIPKSRKPVHFQWIGRP